MKRELNTRQRAAKYARELRAMSKFIDVGIAARNAIIREAYTRIYLAYRRM